MSIASRPLTIWCNALVWALMLSGCQDGAVEVPDTVGTPGSGSTAPGTALEIPADASIRPITPAPGPGGTSCSVGGRTYVHGERFMCADGCNFCHCEDGQIASSGLYCPLATCDTGMVVGSSSECPPPKMANATCAPMLGGTWCAMPLEGSNCPAGSRAIASDAPCTAGARCYAATTTLRCEMFLYTEASCSAVGGTSVYTDSLEAPWFPEGCPVDGDVALGELHVTTSPHQGGLCCAPSQPKGCGARAGDSCSDSEFCAYVEGGLCGRADAQAVCRPRPLGCGAASENEKVCGCNGTTFASACEAALAGQGVYQVGACS